MGHYRFRRLYRSRAAGDATIEQLTEELAQTRRKITQYAAVIAYQKDEIRRLRDAMCACCRVRFEEMEGEFGDCGHFAGESSQIGSSYAE